MTNTGAAMHQPKQGFLDSQFGSRINAARRLVQNKDCGISENCPGYGEQLPLSLAKIPRPFRKIGLVPLGKLTDEMIGVCHSRGFYAFLIRGFQAAIADVFHDGIGEQECVLQYKP